MSIILSLWIVLHSRTYRVLTLPKGPSPQLVGRAKALTAHAIMLTFTTKTTEKGLGFSIEDAPTLVFAFWALTVLTMIVYASGRLMAKSWEGLDFVRMCIPSAAFVCWTMVQKGTAFDAIKSASFSDGMRSAVAIIGAILLGLAASWLAFKADQKQPPKPPQPHAGPRDP